MNIQGLLWLDILFSQNTDILCIYMILILIFYC